MNSKAAKTLRKLVFGDFSYKDKKYVRDAKGTVHCTGKRAVYQVAKKNLKKLKQVIKRINPKRKSGPKWLNPKPAE